MSGSIRDIPKKRGRPPQGGRNQGVMVRLQPDALDRLDTWIECQADEPSRPEAVRRLMEQALAAAAVRAGGKRK
jgi:hypothetical protein